MAYWKDGFELNLDEIDLLNSFIFNMSFLVQKKKKCARPILSNYK
jgi:hypothetical protein